jgi:hypothetical protein
MGSQNWQLALKNSLESDALNLQCFESVEVSEPVLQGNSARTAVSCIDLEGKKAYFQLQAKYGENIAQDYLGFLRMASIMPLLNYGLFAKEIKLNFALSEADFSLVQDFLEIFSKDIFINKLVRKKNPYILPHYVLTKDNAQNGKELSQARITPKNILKDTPIATDPNENSCGVLSSGGKESLLTYGILKEIGAEVHPLYVNESGGHWRTALPAYRYFRNSFPNTTRVWTNVDRLYMFMLDHMRIIRRDHRRIWADTYPIRLCIFPFYVFLLLPIFAKRKIGNILIGSEFDDPRTSPYFAGMRHYFGVYDQTQDFDARMEKWLHERMPGMHQWSAVRSISGLIVERILTSRYPKLARLQRSCHSCRFDRGDLLPCGKCSKCQGILLFLTANKVDPSIMGYDHEDVTSLPTRIAEGNLRLDENEKKYALFLSGLSPNVNDRETGHIETIHFHKQTSDLQLLPARFRSKIIRILARYTKGYSLLKDGSWVKVLKPSDLAIEV